MRVAQFFYFWEEWVHRTGNTVTLIPELAQCDKVLQLGCGASESQADPVLVLLLFRLPPPPRCGRAGTVPALQLSSELWNG